MMSDRGADGSRGSADSASELAFIEGVGWPLPMAFAAAIAGMRFEQGDVIHCDAKAYGSPGGKLPKGSVAIQVLLPPRSARATSGDAEGDRRAANWASETTIALVDLSHGRSETRVVSQGKLATAIFEADESWLDPGREEPPLPRSARELQQHLDETLPAFDARQKRGTRGSRFVFVVDIAQDASRTKATGVEEALRAKGRVERIELSASEAGVEEPDAYHPTARVRCLVMRGRSMDEVLPILRAQLYGGGASAASESSDEDASGTSDRFSIARHGILESIPREATPTR